MGKCSNFAFYVQIVEKINNDACMVNSQRSNCRYAVQNDNSTITTALKQVLLSLVVQYCLFYKWTFTQCSVSVFLTWGWLYYSVKKIPVVYCYEPQYFKYLILLQYRSASFGKVLFVLVQVPLDHPSSSSSTDL